MQRKNIIKTAYKAGVMLVPFLAFSNTNFGAIDPEMSVFYGLSTPADLQAMLPSVRDGSIPANKAIQILIFQDSATQRAVAQAMDSQQLEAIGRQGLAYQQDPSGLLTVAAIKVYRNDVNKFRAGNEGDQTRGILALLDRKRETQEGRNQVVRTAQLELERLRNNGLIPFPPKTVYKIGPFRAEMRHPFDNSDDL
jgi:hypothetical protein